MRTLLTVAAVGAALGVFASRAPSLLRDALLLAPFVAAGAVDIRTRRIPNALSLGAAVLVVTDAVCAGRGLDALLGGGAALLAGVALAVAAHGGFGMGDIKLLAVGGALVGLASVVPLLCAVSIVGGSVALAVLLVRRERGLTMPYGPAIAGGVALLLAVTTRA